MPAETKVQTQAEADEKMVDIPSEGSSVDVEIKDTPTAVTPDNSEIIDVGEKEIVAASESEVEDYGRKVQSRIDKLTKKLRETERREQAAIQYAQGVQGESQQIRNQARALDHGYVAEFGDRVASQIAEAKKSLKDAMDLGDVDKQVDAQAQLSRLAIEEDRAASHKAQRERLAQEMRSRGLTHVNHKCHSTSHHGHKHLLRRIQRQRTGLKKTSGLGKMNQ